MDYRYIDTQLGMHPAYVFPKIFNRMLTVLHSSFAQYIRYNNNTILIT